MIARCAIATPLLCALALAAGAPALAAERYRIDPDHTFVHFAVVHTGVSSVRGRLATAKGSATLDRAGNQGTVEIDIDLKSVDTGVKKLDGILASELFFDVANHKAAHFSGQGTRFADGIPQAFEGQLTLKGVTRPVVLTADRFVCKEVQIFTLQRYVCGGDLSATVSRAEFGLGKYPTMIADQVRLVISVEAIRE